MINIRRLAVASGALMVAMAAAAPASAEYTTGVSAYKAGEVEAAKDIWRRWAEAGDVRSMKILGDLYSGEPNPELNALPSRGDIQINLVEAAKWYLMATIHEFSEFEEAEPEDYNDQVVAEESLEKVRFHMSTGAVKNAEDLVARTYQSGSGFDLYQLARLYRYGRGFQKDNVAALLFYRLAGDRGVDPANVEFVELANLVGRPNLNDSEDRGSKEWQSYESAYSQWQPPLPVEHQGPTQQQRELEKARKALEEIELAEALEAAVDIDVELIQTALNSLGLRAGEPDNEMGPQTRAAIRRFQMANEMDPTGRLSADQKVKLIHKSADFGESRSQYSLGVMYARGVGVTSDGKEALKWLNRAAGQEDALAHYALGIIYRDGTEGVNAINPDRQKAAFHLQQSVTLGFEPAKADLERLTF